MNLMSDKPAIEPLSEAAWRRIENSVFAELDRESMASARSTPVKRTHRRWAVGFVVCATAAVILLWLLPGDGEQSPERLAEPSRIMTEDAATQLTVGRASLTVAPQSAVWLQTDRQGSVHVILEQGAIECAVTPHGDRPPVVVQAGDVRVEVVGTRFSVTRDGDSAHVSVDKGVVAVFHAGERSDVRAGQSWPTEVADRSPDLTTPSSVARAPAVQAKPERRAVTAPQRANIDRTSTSSERPRKRRMSAKTRYEHAARLEAQQPDRALAIYEQLARGNSAWAANALFAQARLSMDRGDRRAAKRLLQAYLRRFPDGANAIDARELAGHLK